jgi:RNA-directed DNA polymerase
MSKIIVAMAIDLLLSGRELLTITSSAPHRYKVYQIPKRVPGLFRTIAQPAREVKALQYWLMKNVLNRFESHQCAMAYRAGRGIRDNAVPHVAGRFLLKLDFVDFFSSIKAWDFRRYLEEKDPEMTEEELEMLCNLTFWKPRGTHDFCLSIGAPTSPIISNLLMYKFDKEVDTFCLRKECVYTRYADDLTFSATDSSTLEAVEAFVAHLCSVITSPCLTINTHKTVRSSRAYSRRVTSLVLTNDNKISLGRERKRKISAWVHHFKLGHLDEKSANRLQGMLAYVAAVEPDFIVTLQRKYGESTVSAIRRRQ